MFNLRVLKLATLAFMTAGAASAATAAGADPDWLQELETRCEAGGGQSCAILGNQLANGYGVEKDLVRARAAYEKGCKLENASACASLYEALSFGRGGPADPARARALGKRVCSSGILAQSIDLKAKGLCKEG